jgi:hypothetical protein
LQTAAEFRVHLRPQKGIIARRRTQAAFSGYERDHEEQEDLRDMWSMHPSSSLLILPSNLVDGEWCG